MATEIIKKSMYNGEIEISFYPKSHQYKINGENINSVTSITGVYDKSGPLMRWAVQEAKKYLAGLIENNSTITMEDVEKSSKKYLEKKDEAADIGKLAHDWVEKYTRDQTVSLPDDPRVINVVSGFIDWKTNNDVEFIEQELFVYSKKYNYCGTLDALVRINGKLYLLDYKTSNAIRKMEYGMQTAGYKIAREEEFPEEKIEGIIVLRFNKEEFDKDGAPLPLFEAWEVEDVKGFETAFLAARVLKSYGKQYEYKRS